MRLNAARDLKEEILAALPSFVVRGEDGETPPVAVGVAPAPHAGEFRVAIRVRGDGDLPPSAFRYLERVTIGELDVRITGPITACGGRLAAGVSTAHARGPLGTLGCFAERGGRLGFISNNHVIAAEDRGVDGDEVLHVEDGTRERVVGRLAGDYPRLKSGVDCAFAHLVEGVDFEPSTITGERLSAVPVGPAGYRDVGKVGRTTGRTSGRITAFGLNELAVNYSFGQIRFQNQIEIESATHERFSAPGDSGSLIFTDDGHPIGLLHAGSLIGGHSNAGLTYANPILTVVDALGITLVT